MRRAPGCRSFVVVPAGNIALGKLSQAVMHGAKVLAVEGSFDDAFNVVRGVADKRDVTVVNSINRYRLQGQKTAAFEICDTLGGRAPDYHILPVGNAGNITAYWMGYREYRQDGKSDRLPKMMGFQAAVPRRSSTASRCSSPRPRDCHPHRQSRELEAGRRGARRVGRGDRGGHGQEIIEAYKLLASTEGVFAEPASAVSIAALVKLAAAKRIERGAVVVCTLTGHGLKDPNNAIKVCAEPVTLPPDVDRDDGALARL